MLLEDRKPRQYYNQGRVHFRRGRPYNFTGPSHSKASVSRGGDKKLNINEAISSQRHMRGNIHRTSLSFGKSTSQLTQSEYDARRKFADLNEVALIKTPGTRNIVAQAEVNSAASKWKGLPLNPTEVLLRPFANTESSNGHIQREARQVLVRTSTRIPETSHTEFKPMDNKIHSEVKLLAYFNARAYTNECPRQTESLVDSSVVNDDQTTDHAQEKDNTVTADKRIADTSLKLNPPSYAAEHNTFIDQHHDMRDYQQRIRRRPHEQPHLGLTQQPQASSAPTSHPISFSHSGSTQLRQRYQASLSNIRAVQNYRRREVLVGIRKDRTFEELSNAFFAGGNYTISQDHTAGEETRRSHLLANFGRRCGSNMDKRKQLEVADDELNPPAINIEFAPSYTGQHDLTPPGHTWSKDRTSGDHHVTIPGPRLSRGAGEEYSTIYCSAG